MQCYGINTTQEYLQNLLLIQFIIEKIRGAAEIHKQIITCTYHWQTFIGNATARNRNIVVATTSQLEAIENGLAAKFQI